MHLYTKFIFLVVNLDRIFVENRVMIVYAVYALQMNYFPINFPSITSVMENTSHKYTQNKMFYFLRKVSFTCKCLCLSENNPTLWFF